MILVAGGLLVLLTSVGIFWGLSKVDWLPGEPPEQTALAQATLLSSVWERSTPPPDLSADMLTPVSGEATPTSSVPTHSPAEMVTGPTLTPTPTPTPIAPNAIQGLVRRVSSSGGNYDAVVAGRGDVTLTHAPPEDDVRIGQVGLIWAEGDDPGWQVERAFLEFDTSAIKALPNEVILRFRMIVKIPGFAVPQAVHRGTWPGAAADQPPEVLWQAYQPQPLATFLETDTSGLEPPVTMEKTVMVSLPPDAITLGGTTRLMVRTTLEGEAPPVGRLNCETCMQIVVYDNANLLIGEGNAP